MKKLLTVFILMISMVMLAQISQAVELTLYVNEPQSDRCRQNIHDATEALKEVNNVNLIIVPHLQSPADAPQAPAVAIDGKVIVENNGFNNGRMRKDALLEALIKHGAVPYSEGYRVINAARLRKMLDAKKSNVMIVDVRIPEEYQEIHIQGAVNIPEKKFAENKDKLPKEKNKTMVFYCNGGRCANSRQTAQKAVAEGFKDVLVYQEGMVTWEELNYPMVKGPEYGKKIITTKISPRELKKLIDAKSANYLLIDVRDESDFKQGHIPTAINIPVANLAARSGEIDNDKNIIVYCNSGGKSNLGYRKLMQLSYDKIYQTTLADWIDAEMPIEF